MTLHAGALSNEAFVDAFISATGYLTDVDATAVALAGPLGKPLRSDDGKVRRIFQQLYPALELHATLSLIRDVSERLGLSREALREMLVALHHKVRFVPPRRDPLRDWYQEHLSPE